MNATVTRAQHEGELSRQSVGVSKVVVLIPAHNEEGCIAGALRSVWSQGRAPDRVVVVADNCADRTAEVARIWGAEVFETVGNRHKKAGALNQALEAILPELDDGDDGDAVLVMDADSFLDGGFIGHALEKL